MNFIAMLNGREAEIGIARRRPVLQLRIGNRSVEVEESAAEDGAFEITVDGRRHRGWRYQSGTELFLRLGNRSFVLDVLDRHAGRAGAGGSGNELRAEMPGTVIDVACRPGAAVTAGQALLTIESMKMQMVVAAPFDAVVETIHVAPNASFERKALLVSLKPV
jgi:acetyl/propionyl-CoA carboxylase alpha subunit